MQGKRQTRISRIDTKKEKQIDCSREDEECPGEITWDLTGQVQWKDKRHWE